MHPERLDIHPMLPDVRQQGAVHPCQPAAYTPRMNEKPVQPDPLACQSPTHLEGPGYAMTTGPVTFGGGHHVGVYLADDDCERLLALIKYAAERLDSGKVSPELKASERIIRRLLPLLERDVVGVNRRWQEEYARKHPYGQGAALDPEERKRLQASTEKSEEP